MTATTKVLLSYCCNHYTKMLSVIITIMSKLNTNPHQNHPHYF